MKRMPFIAGATLHLLLAASATAAAVPDPSLPPVQATDLTNGTFRVKIYGGREQNCLSSNLTYHRILGASPKWRVPHSLISMDGVRCGSVPVDAPDSAFNSDTWTDVFPYGLVASQRAAQQSGMIRALSHFRAQGTVRDYVSLLEGDLGRKRAAQEILLAFEGTAERRCGDVTLPRYSFAVFARNTNATVNFGSLLHGVSGVRLMLSKGVPYHAQFAPTGIKGDRERFCPYLLPNDFHKAYPIRACFPAEARVRMEGGREVRMDALKLGDRVAFIDEEGRMGFSPVILFTHRDASAEMHEFVQMDMRTGERITLSPGHYVDEGRAAADITPGDFVRTADGKLSEVVSVERVRAQGLYNPHPASGRLIVDGVSVTAYTQWLQPAAAHAAMLPVRLAHVGEGLRWRQISVRVIRLVGGVVAQGELLLHRRSGF